MLSPLGLVLAVVGLFLFTVLLYQGTHFLSTHPFHLLSFLPLMSIEPRITGWLSGLNVLPQIVLAVVVPFAVLLIHPVKDTTAFIGALVGTGIGYSVLYWYGDIQVEGPWKQRMIRYVIGTLVVVAIYFGLRAVFPPEGAPLYLPFRFVRLLAVGLCVSLGAPLLFNRLRLMSISVSPGRRTT